jgi:hypothetical protein
MGWDSLVVANTVELLGGGVPSANPACLGAMFRLQPGADPGAPQPTTDFVASLLLDGERPFGRRASNRTVKLPVWITAPDRRTLAAAREVLQQAIDQDYFTITWTRDPAAGNPGGLPLPLLLDCFRAQPTVPVFNTLMEKQLIGQQVQLTIPALPYGRSDTQVQVSFSSPVPANPPVAPPPSPVTLDNFAEISSSQCSQSNRCVVGPTSCRWDPDSFGDPGGQKTAFTYGSSFAAPLNLTGMTSLKMWLGLGSRWWANLEYHGKIHGAAVYVTLTDTSGNTLSFSRSHLYLPVADDPDDPLFTPVTMMIPGGSPSFDYASVGSYKLEVVSRHDRIRRLSWVTAYLDDLTAYPGSQQAAPVTRGTVYTLYGVQGTARAPVSMVFQQPPTAGTPTTVTVAGPGSYTVPASTAYLKVEAWGGGGAGAGMSVAGTGPGGGGAEYAAQPVFPALAGDVIPYVVGGGDTPGVAPAGGQSTVFGPAPGSALQVMAHGGGSAATNATVAGAGGIGSAAYVEHPGGAGAANPPGTFGGGGGSSGGPLAAGATPVGSGSQLFTAAGSFTWTCPPGVEQVLAECWGAGGGGGSGGNNGNGAGGGGGAYWSALVNVTPGNSYTGVVGAGGAGGVNAGDAAGGGESSFTGDNGTVAADGGAGGQGNVQGGGAYGGSGGSGTTGYLGGRGGPGYPYTGGGGSSAGPAAPGNLGGSPGGAPAPGQGGPGGDGSGNQAGAGAAGGAPGGGGGGTWDSSYACGAGAPGQVRITYPASTGAPTPAGGTAVTGGGAGGAGGAAAGDAGTAGGAPGGGGGGAFSAGTVVPGGGGGTGQLTITPYAPAAFKTLIVHRPPLGARKTFMPMVSVGDGNDVPNGTTQYTMPQPVTGVNADFHGTYTVYLIAASWDGGATSTTTRTITVTVWQYEFAGGPSYPVSTLPVTVSPSQVSNGIITAGVLTLPPKLVAPDNTGGYYTVSVSSSDTLDRFYDVLFLDTMGQAVVINEPSQGYQSYYVDAPDPVVSLGRIMGSQNGRPDAISVMDNTPYISGGALYLEPADGDNQLFVYSADGAAPDVSLSYWPCYYFDRTQ